MPSKRRKSNFQGPRRVYSTREIMEITEERRVKREIIKRDVETKVQVPQEEPVLAQEDSNPPVVSPPTEASHIQEEIESTVSQDPVPEPLRPSAFDPQSLVSLTLLSGFFLIVSLKLPESWMDTLANKLNHLVLYGSFFVLNTIQGPCTVQGAVLNTHYYKLSLQGDLTGFYAAELLFIFVILFSSIQKKVWIKKGGVFISLVPLVLVANMIRVLWACGLALNYGTTCADRYLHGALVDFVFIFIVLGLIFLEFLFIFDGDSN